MPAWTANTGRPLTDLHRRPHPGCSALLSAFSVTAGGDREMPHISRLFYLQWDSFHVFPIFTVILRGTFFGTISLPPAFPYQRYGAGPL